jgi:N-dimethylarginine dimethylaminohydrolase
LIRSQIFKVYIDSGSDDTGTASGFGYIIFLSDTALIDDLAAVITALTEAIRADEITLRNQYA